MRSVVNISLETDLLQRLNEVCDSLGISRSRFIAKSCELLLIDIDNPITTEYLLKKKAGADE
jgi:metal-responsive CopG/Arc/MetJ family transcriptional regulator